MGNKSDKKKGEPEKAKKAKKSVEKTAEKPVKKVEPAIVAPTKPKAAAKPKAKKAAKPTFEEIQLQAYFVAERRLAAGLPGDSASDWIQAEQELLAARS